MSKAAMLLLERLRSKATKGMRGFPLGTLAFYGPDDERASKLVASIVARKGAAPSPMQKWYSESGDVRNDLRILDEVLEFIDANGARSIVMPDRIIGCPHEEGIDYQGSVCPHCPFWAIRDRWTGEVIQ